MTVYAFNEANGTQVSSITGTSLSGGGLGGAVSDVQTNGSGQAINTNDFTTIGLYKTGTNRSRITLTTGYTGNLTSYVTPQIAVDGSNSGYIALLQLDTGTTYNRVQFQEDGSFFSAPFLTTPLDVSAGVVELDLYLNGTTLTLDIYQSSVLHEQVTVGSANLSRQGSGIVWAYQGTQEQVEAWDDNLAGDVTPPVLSLPTGTATGDTTASGTVTTNEDNGTLHYYASINSSETAATIKASGSSQIVNTSGVQNVTVSGLTSGTTYYIHYVQDDAATNESNVVSSPSFVTDVESIITVDIPLHINLKWDETHDLIVTDDSGSAVLSNVTLSTPSGWETVIFNGIIPIAGDTESFYEYALTDTTLGGSGYTMQAGDILAWETQTGLTVDNQTIPIIDPPATATGSYKIWKESENSWTNVSAFTIQDNGEFQVSGTVAVTLEDETMTATGTVAVPITGSLASILADVSSTSSGTVGGTVGGTLSETLDNVISIASGTITITGTAINTLADVISNSVGNMTIEGSTNSNLEDTTSSSTGTTGLTGSIAETLDGTIISATGFAVSNPTGVSNITLDDVISNSLGVIPIVGTSSVTLDDLITNITGSVTLEGTINETLDGTASNSNGLTTIEGTIVGVEDDTLIVASGDVTFPNATGTIDITLDEINIDFNGNMTILANLTETLDDDTMLTAPADPVIARIKYVKVLPI